MNYCLWNESLMKLKLKLFLEFEKAVFKYINSRDFSGAKVIFWKYL